jgi:chemotaxis methyl-accepting protein methylase
MSAFAEPTFTELARECGIPLAAYRAAHVRRCLERALARSGSATVTDLTDRMREDPRVRTAFRTSVLVSVTGMFRDPDEFALLGQTVIPTLMANPGPIRVWSAGCAHGDELHSVAALLDRVHALDRAFMLGTDVRSEALAEAAQQVGELSVDLRTVLRFEHHDLVLDRPPAAGFHLILCRNVAIYLERAAQHELREKLVSALRPGGYLMLGRSETLVRPEQFGLERVSRHTFRRARR